MIEVTDEMLKVARSMQSFELMIKRIIELHEANRPKPEPVGYAYPSQYAEALENEGCFMVFVVPVTNLDTGEESSLPLYTTPPTREPLSDYELREMLNDLNKGDGTIYDFARAIEQAHGIGVTND